MGIRWKLWVPVGLTIISGVALTTTAIVLLSKDKKLSITLDIDSEKIIWGNDFGMKNEIIDSIKQKSQSYNGDAISLTITVDGQNIDDGSISFSRSGNGYSADFYTWLNSTLPLIMEKAQTPSLPFNSSDRTVFDIPYFDLDNDKWLVHYWTEHDLVLDSTKINELNSMLNNSVSTSAQYIRLFSLPQRHNDDLGASLGLIHVENMNEFFIQPQNSKKLVVLSQERLTYGWSTNDNVYRMPLDHNSVYAILLDAEGNYIDTISMGEDVMRQVWSNEEFLEDVALDVINA